MELLSYLENGQPINVCMQLENKLSYFSMA